MNYKQIKEICEGILENLKCNLYEGNPCATCSSAIFRDIEKLCLMLKEEEEE